MPEQISEITELFAVPRGTIQLVVNYGGVKIYTSAVLKKNFIKAMLKSSRISPIMPTIVKLMGSGEFTPCYLTKKIINSILKKQPPELKGYAGVTLGKYILVFIDNDTNIFGFTSNDELSITSLHELTHKASNRFPKQFLSMFKNELISFYTTYWSTLFSLKKGIEPKNIQNLFGFIYSKTERGDRSNRTLVTYHTLLLDTFTDFTTLSPDQLKELVTKYIVLIKLIWKGADAGVPSLIEKAIFANRQIITPLYNTYKSVFGINVKQIKELCYQELYAPSEVIALPALIKRPNPKIYKIINKL